MLQATAITKKYGSFTALNEISFSIKRGEIVGLLGPNGAGKTTLIKILTGFFEPTAGELYINGINALTSPQEAKALIGYLPENSPFYSDLTVQETLRLFCGLQNINGRKAGELLKEAVEATDLWPVLTKPVSQLSKGFKQRLGLARAILQKPPLIILDEPTNGLDPEQINKFIALIRELGRQSTIIFSTHILPQIENCCKRALILHGGKLQADVNLDGQKETNSFTLVLNTLEVPEIFRGEWQQPPLTEVKIEPREGRLFISATAPADFDLGGFFYEKARAANLPLGELYQNKQSLAAMFNAITTGREVLPCN